MIPLVTNDPAGDMPAQEKMALACQIVSDRKDSGLSLTDVTGNIMAELGDFKYYFLLQDVINFCTFS